MVTLDLAEIATCDWTGKLKIEPKKENDNIVNTA